MRLAAAHSLVVEFSGGDELRLRVWPRNRRAMLCTHLPAFTCDGEHTEVRGDVSCEPLHAHFNCLTLGSTQFARRSSLLLLMPASLLCSLQRTGLLSMLDVESSLRGNPETYVAKIKAQHRSNSRYFDVQPAVNGSAAGAAVAQYSNTPSAESRLFGIRHFAGNVVYDAANFLRANRDTVSDDVVAVFHKTSCTFGFATHLFGMQVRRLAWRRRVAVFFVLLCTHGSDTFLRFLSHNPVSLPAQDAIQSGWLAARPFLPHLAHCSQ